MSDLSLCSDLLTPEAMKQFRRIGSFSIDRSIFSLSTTNGGNPTVYRLMFHYGEEGQDQPFIHLPESTRRGGHFAETSCFLWKIVGNFRIKKKIWCGSFCMSTKLVIFKHKFVKTKTDVDFSENFTKEMERKSFANDQQKQKNEPLYPSPEQRWGKTLKHSSDAADCSPFLES